MGVGKTELGEMALTHHKQGNKFTHVARDLPMCEVCNVAGIQRYSQLTDSQVLA